MPDSIRSCRKPSISFNRTMLNCSRLNIYVYPLTTDKNVSTLFFIIRYQCCNVTMHGLTLYRVVIFKKKPYNMQWFFYHCYAQTAERCNIKKKILHCEILYLRSRKIYSRFSALLAQLTFSVFVPTDLS